MLHRLAIGWITCRIVDCHGLYCEEISACHIHQIDQYQASSQFPSFTYVKNKIKGIMNRYIVIKLLKNVLKIICTSTNQRTAAMENNALKNCYICLQYFCFFSTQKHTMKLILSTTFKTKQISYLIDKELKVPISISFTFSVPQKNPFW